MIPAHDMDGFKLKQHLTEGNRAYGTAILTASPLWPPLVAKTGIDFVFIGATRLISDARCQP